MRPIAPLFLALGLAACTAPLGPGTYRDTRAPISSIALFDAARLDGTWHEVASYREQGACVLCRAAFSQDGGAVAMQSGAGTVRLQPSGPGRLTPQGVRGRLDAEWWVLWVDADYRTIVLGTPSGGFGMILDRGRIGADRLKVAREILQWAGYDLARLKPAGT